MDGFASTSGEDARERARPARRGPRVASETRDSSLDPPEDPDQTTHVPSDPYPASLVGAALDPAAPAIAIGSTLEPFRIAAELGRGGGGTVYLAHQATPARMVALKLFGVRLAAGSEGLVRFQRESRFLGSFKHDHLVRVFAAGDFDGVPYLAMEFVEGESLQRVVRPGGISIPRAVLLVAQVGRALAYIHNRGIIHRDLKPANILVQSDAAGTEKALLADFGLARSLDDQTLTRTGAILGTPAYMAPEQALGSPDGPDVRSDIYGLGATLYHLLTGRRPHEADSTQALLVRIASEDPVTPRRMRREIPRDLESVVLRMMAREPERRYQTAAEAAEDLERFLAGRPVRATPPTLVYVTRRFIVRHRAASAVAAAAFTILAGLAGWSYWNVDRERRIAIESETTTRSLLARSEADRIRDGDFVRLERALAQARELWPAHPARIGAMGEWLDESRDLLSRAPRHAAARDDLAPSRSADSTRVSETLDRLVEGLRTLAEETVPDIESRIVRARDLGRVMHESEAVWSEAIRSIEDEAECPAYDGLVVEPQMGLVPIGRDPDSGLWEFAVVQSGSIPRRDRNGWLRMEGEGGIVLVLIPGGSFRMGAVCEGDGPVDPLARSDEGPVHLVELDPFFLSKAEMTRGQWISAGEEPLSGLYFEDALSHFHAEEDHRRLPIEYVTWTQGREVLKRFGLDLPTEAQWEYAARGGTTTVWWTGDDPESLRWAANLADHSLERAERIEVPLDATDDGYPHTSPAGTFRVNPFGIWDVQGNAQEWCLDLYGSYASPTRPGTGERDLLASGEGERVTRGGDCHTTADRSRSASRYWLAPGGRLTALGLRPARRLDR